jgi:hypothetical protein
MFIQIEHPMHLMTCKKILQYVTIIGPTPHSNLKSNPQGRLRVKLAQRNANIQIKRWKQYVQAESKH